MKTIVVVCAVLFASWTATAQKRTGTTGADASLKGEVSALRSKLASLEETNKNLSRRLMQLELARNRYTSAALDLTNHNYQRLDTDIGTFTVSVVDVTPYLDGYKVILKIGNPSAATFEGFKISATWNWAISSAENFSYEKWIKNQHNKETSFTTSLLPGHWTRVELLLSQTKADELGYFEISMETNTMSLISSQ